MHATALETRDRRSLTVYDAGDPGGVPVIVHHGTPMSGRPWEQHVRLAEQQRVRLISFDRAGYGESTRHRGRRVVDVAADVADIADALGIGRFSTFGISGGGPHALACAARLGDRVAAAATVSGIAPPDAEGLDFLAGMGEGNIHEFHAAQDGEATLRPLLEAEAEGMRAATAEQLVEAMRSILSEVDVAALTSDLGEYLLATINEGLERGVDGWVDDDLAFVTPWGFDVAEIEPPVLVVQGRHDLMVPFDHGVWLSTHVRGAEARLEEDAGHVTQFQPDAVSALNDWLCAPLRSG